MVVWNGLQIGYQEKSFKENGGKEKGNRLGRDHLVEGWQEVRGKEKVEDESDGKTEVAVED